MDLTKGFQLTSPNKFVPWRINALELEDLFGGNLLKKIARKFVPWRINALGLEDLFDGKPLKKITKGYYTIDCEPLPGLLCVLGFHLHQNDVLTELEFLRRDYSDQKASYEDFQAHFETVFGVPTKTTDGEEGYPRHEWRIPGAVIVHYINNRFGPEEHMHIRRR